jgi:hypothetical protein
MNTDTIVANLKTAAIPLVVGYLMFKFGKSALIKGAGAGVIGVQALSTARSITGI